MPHDIWNTNYDYPCYICRFACTNRIYIRKCRHSNNNNNNNDGNTNEIKPDRTHTHTGPGTEKERKWSGMRGETVVGGIKWQGHIYTLMRLYYIHLTLSLSIMLMISYSFLHFPTLFSREEWRQNAKMEYVLLFLLLFFWSGGGRWWYNVLWCAGRSDIEVKSFLPKIVIIL